MGIARTHLCVAEAIGFDAYMLMWQIYDADPVFRTERGDLAIKMRPYRSYQRFQRNRIIETLLAEGKKPAEVKARLRTDLCEEVSAGHISRIGRKGRMRA